MVKRIGIATGGTGGHIFPALGLARSLQNQHEVTFFGVNLEGNQFFPKDEFPYISVDGANFQKGMFFGMRKIFRGFWQSRRKIKALKLSQMVGFGSFYSLPPLLAALSLRIPVTIYEPNIAPGKINRFLSRVAKQSFVHFEKTALSLSCGSTLVDIGFDHKQSGTKEEELAFFGLGSTKKTVLVFGGSQGAKEINEMFLPVAKRLKEKLQVIHIVGADESVKEFYETEGIAAYVMPFCHELHRAYKACDFTISRSGAGAIREQFNYEKPAIFIPFRFSAEDHQYKNAKYMAEEVSGALVVERGDMLIDLVNRCLDTTFTDALRSNLSEVAKGVKVNSFKESVLKYSL